MTELPENINPVELVNQLAALAADVPACEHCDAETELIATEAGDIAGIAVHHDDGCRWLAEHFGNETESYENRRFFSIEELAKVEAERNNTNE